MSEPIEDFLDGALFAVVGASSNRDKYGNKVLRSYQQAGLEAYPIHPVEKEVEGKECFPNLTVLSKHLAEKSQELHGVSIITPPTVTEKVIEEIIELGIQHVWMQPGAESQSAIARAQEAGVNVIADGPCILVKLRYRED